VISLWLKHRVPAYTNDELQQLLLSRNNKTVTTKANSDFLETTHSCLVFTGAGHHGVF